MATRVFLTAPFLRFARKERWLPGLVACVVNGRTFFLYGYAKSELDNIGDAALEAFRANAADLQKLPSYIK